MTRFLDFDVALKGAEPLAHHHAPEIQAYAHVSRMPIALSENACYEEQHELVDATGEWIQLLAGVSMSMAPIAAKMALFRVHRRVARRHACGSPACCTPMKWPSRNRAMAGLVAKSGGDGSNELMVSEVIPRNEVPVWFVAEHCRSAATGAGEIETCRIAVRHR